MRWKAVVMGLALALSAAAGCGQKCFVDQDSWYSAQAGVQLACSPETNPEAGVRPITPSVPTPTTVDEPRREQRYLSLAEAISVALEKGSVGVQSTRVL